jgi:hypothetical protein
MIASAACGTTPTSDVKLPPEDQSLDPSRVVEPAVLYACGAWWQAQPGDERVVIDLAFNVPGAVSPPAHLLELVRGEASVLYTFRFAAVRIWVSTAAIPTLVTRIAATGTGAAAYRAPDLARYDWRVIVGYRANHPVSEADETRFAQLGGRVEHRLEGVNQLIGIIPNRSLSSLRAEPGVAVVDAVIVYCSQ